MQLHEFTTAQLKQALKLKEQIEDLQQKLDAILGTITGKTNEKWVVPQKTHDVRRHP